MKKEEITALFGKFESISCEVEGIECWSARELQPLLGYAKWDNFINNVVVKAKEACRRRCTKPFSRRRENGFNRLWC